MKLASRQVSVLLALFLIFVSIPVYGEGIKELSLEGEGVRITKPGTYRISGEVEGGRSHDGIAIDAAQGDFTIYLNNVKITKNNDYRAAFYIKENSQANVTIILEGENELYSGMYHAGIDKGQDNDATSTGTLTIKGQGSLKVSGGQRGAAIGGGNGRHTENIIIEGGKITAIANRPGKISRGAGIGGGDGGNGRNITIKGGTIITSGSTNNDYAGAGIGGGNNGQGSNIRIEGGTIRAIGGKHGSAIGGGCHEAGENITISGGHVRAIGGLNGAAIGSGSRKGSDDENAFASNINLTGGTIVAETSGDGPALGSVGRDESRQGNTIIEGNVHVTTSADHADNKVIHNKGIYNPKKSSEAQKIIGQVVASEDVDLAENTSVTLVGEASLTLEEGNILTIPSNSSLTNRGTIYIYDESQIVGEVTNVDSGQIIIIEPPTVEYEVSLSSNLEDAGTLTGGGRINSGEEMTVTATANTGYEFLKWTVDGEKVSQEPVYTFTVNEDIELVAVFRALDVYRINLTASPEEGGNLQGGGDYYEGQEVTIKASPNQYYNFIQWKDGETVLSNQKNYSFTPNASMDLVAVFESTLVNVAVESVQVNGADGTEDTTTIELIFDQEVPLTAEDISLTGATLDEVGVEGSKAILAISNITVANGEAVSLSLAKDGYHFNEASHEVAVYKDTRPPIIEVAVESVQANGSSGTEDTTAIELTFDREIPLTAEDISLTGATLDEVSVEGTKATLAISNITVANGESITLSLAKDGYQFAQSQHQVLVYKYIPPPVEYYTLVLSANPEGGGRVSGENTYRENEEVTILATPNEGYTFKEWRVGNEVFSTEASHTFNIDSNLSIVAIFQEIEEVVEFKVTLNPNGGELSTTELTTINHKLSQLPIPTYEGYEFKAWFVDEALTIPFDINTELTKDIELYGKWVKIEEEPMEPDDPIVDPEVPEDPGEDPTEDQWPDYPYFPIHPKPSDGHHKKPSHNSSYPFNELGDGSKTEHGDKNIQDIIDDGQDIKMDIDEPVIDNPFIDVPEDAFYVEAVLWAVNKGITTGTNDTTFSPQAECTRAEMVTFLWRTAGKPEPIIEASFTDIGSDSYYYKAVLWGYENNIVNGISSTEFSPDEIVTRSQTVTFLWRLAGKDNSGDHSFVDVEENQYYSQAVAWANSHKITQGISETEFAPGDACTRGQIVTFLYRQLGQ